VSFQATIAGGNTIRKPVLGRQLNDRCTTLQRIKRKVTARAGTKPVDQHHLRKTGLQTDASTLMSLLHTVGLTKMRTEEGWRGEMHKLLNGHVISKPSKLDHE
jgi:hypothetical protein